MSIWDDILKGRNQMLNPKGKTRVAQFAADLDASYFYSEADMLEDQVLFPEELYTETSNALYSGEVNALEGFVKGGPDWEYVHCASQVLGFSIF